MFLIDLHYIAAAFKLNLPTPPIYVILHSPPVPYHPTHGIWIISNRSSGLKSGEEGNCMPRIYLLNVWLCHPQISSSRIIENGSPGIYFPTTSAHFQFDPIPRQVNPLLSILVMNIGLLSKIESYQSISQSCTTTVILSGFIVAYKNPICYRPTDPREKNGRRLRTATEPSNWKSDGGGVVLRCWWMAPIEK